MAEQEQRLPETPATLLRFHLRPEQLNQLLARVSTVGIVGQVGEQRPGLLRREVGDHPIAPLGSQAAQELDTPAAVHGLHW